MRQARTKTSVVSCEHEFINRQLSCFGVNDQSESIDEQLLQSRIEYLQALKQNANRECRLVNKLERAEADLLPILIDPQHVRGWGLDAVINGRTTRLLLDTGASGILVDRAYAEKAGLGKAASIRYSGIGDKGFVEGYVAYADSIKIGQFEFHDCLIQITEKRALPDHGLIGADVFSDYLVDIDFPAHKFRLEPLPKRPDEEAAPARLKTTEAAAEPGPASNGSARGPRDRYLAPEMKDWTQVFRFGHELLIPTSVNDGQPKLFLLDTGSMTNSISVSAARESTKASRDADTRIRGISGEVDKVYNADKAVLRFSHFRQENQEVVAFDFSGLSRGAGTEVSGTLGYTLLQMLEIKIDYRDGLVDFVYDKEKLRRFR